MNCKSYNNAVKYALRSYDKIDINSIRKFIILLKDNKYKFKVDPLLGRFEINLGKVGGYFFINLELLHHYNLSKMIDELNDYVVSGGNRKILLLKYILKEVFSDE